MGREYDPDWLLIDQLDDEGCPEMDDEPDCAKMPDGQCLLAGTEHCDWDCGRLG